jgi:aldehyde dehydrogenase (NAD+)
MNTAQSIVERQKAYFYSNQTRPISFRKQQLKTLKKALQEHEQKFYDALKKDLGKSTFESFISEFGFIIKDIEHTLSHIDEWAEKQLVTSSILSFPSSSYILKEPYGVSLVISPWNYPLQLAIAPVVGAIAAGNTVILKPSEFAPATANALSSMCKQYFPEGFLTVVEGGAEITQDLLRSPIDYLFFTGSPKVAKLIMKTASEQLIPHTLELGGKSPCIVDKTAPIKLSAKRIAHGKFFNAGQTCIAPDYLLIDKEIADDFLSELTAIIKEFYGENPKNSEDYGRIIHDGHFKRLASFIADGTIVCGGEVDEKTRYIAPTVVKNVSLDSPIMQEEIFGPILPVIIYQSENEIVPFIRGFEKPLALYHFTRNKALKEKLLQQISFGGGVINDTLEHLMNPELPFGGVGTSGIGAYHGKYSFDSFSHKKSILQKSSRIDIPLKYPPYKGKLNLIRKLFKIS